MGPCSKRKRFQFRMPLLRSAGSPENDNLSVKSQNIKRLKRHHTFSHAQGTYNLMSDTYKGKPVYVHTSGEYYMYWQDDYKNWHAWVEIGSMYAGFFAYGRNTKALSSTYHRTQLNYKK